MAEQRTSKKDKNGREDRLKAALKANLARRKVQARGRSASERDAGDRQDRDGQAKGQ